MKRLIIIMLLSVSLIAIVYALNKPEIERLDFIHYQKPDGSIGMMTAMAIEEGPCYGADFWYDYSYGPSYYVINPTNEVGLSDDFIFQTFYEATKVWDDETDTNMFPNYIYFTDQLNAGTYDGYNVVSFGELPSNIIAWTSFWYWTDTLEIIEWDMEFNELFPWGDADYETGIMDFKSLSVHELGHTFGLYDLYQPGCSHVSMYGYSDYDETNKRTLEAPDIYILQYLYGGKSENPLTYFGKITTRVNVSA